MLNLKSGKGVGDDLYDGAATFGRFMATISLVIGVLTGLILIGISIYLLVTPARYTELTTAKVNEAKCDRVPTGDSRGFMNDCIMKIEYTVDGKQIVKDHNSKGKYYSVGDTIKIRYDPSNPEDFSTSMSRKTVGWILLAIGIPVIFLSWLSWWIATTFKFAAAATGVGTAYNIVRY